MCRTHTSFEKDHICPIDKCGLSRGDPYGTRTHVTAVKGRCLNHLTNGPGSGNLIRTDDIPGMNDSAAEEAKKAGVGKAQHQKQEDEGKQHPDDQIHLVDGQGE